MSELKEVEKRRPFLTPSEQQVLLALESLLPDGSGRVPPLEEVRKALRRLKLKPLKTARISQIITALEKKGYVVKSLEIVKREEAVA